MNGMRPPVAIMLNESSSLKDDQSAGDQCSEGPDDAEYVPQLPAENVAQATTSTTVDNEGDKSDAHANGSDPEDDPEDGHDVYIQDDATPAPLSLQNGNGETSDVSAAGTGFFRDGYGAQPTDVFIAVMGVTGVGKSTFISLCTEKELQIGHGLQGCK